MQPTLRDCAAHITCCAAPSIPIPPCQPTLLQVVTHPPLVPLPARAHYHPHRTAHTTPHHNMSHCTALQRTIPRHCTHRTAPHRTTPRHTTPHHTSLHDTTPHHTTSHQHPPRHTPPSNFVPPFSSISSQPTPYSILPQSGSYPCMLSREHARVVFDGHAWFLEDISAPNGLAVNDVRVRPFCRSAPQSLPYSLMPICHTR